MVFLAACVAVMCPSLGAREPARQEGKTGQFAPGQVWLDTNYAVADNILGPWESKGNPCTGPEAQLTFRSQSTCVLPVAGKPGAFVFMADRWMPRQLSDSRYIWLPFTIGPAGAFTIPWLDTWDLSWFDKR